MKLRSLHTSRARTSRLPAVSLRGACHGVLTALALLCCVATSDSAWAAGDRAGRTATSLRLSKSKEGGLVKMSFTAAPRYMARFEDNKRRLVVDVLDAELGRVPASHPRPVGRIESVLAQTFHVGDSFTTRVIVNLAEGSTASVVANGRDLLVQAEADPEEAKEARVRAQDEAASPSPEPRVEAEVTRSAGEAAERPPRRTSTSSREATSSNAAATTAADPNSTVVRDVGYSHEDAVDSVSVRVARYASVEEQRPRPGQSRLVIRGVQLGPRVPEALDVSAFRGSVESIRTVYDENAEAVLVDVERSTGAKSTLEELEGKIRWSFFEPGQVHSSRTGIAADGGAARRARTLHVEDIAADIPKVEGGVRFSDEPSIVAREAGEQVAAVEPKRVGGAPGYSGRRIDLDLKDADVHNVLRLLADVGKVNIVTADNVGGTVTIRMRNVPWDQALDVVLQSKGLGMVRGGNIIRVAPLPQLEKEREMAIARRQQELKLAPLETRLIPVSYASAADIQARAREILSGRGSIAVDGRTNVLIARDVSGTLDQVEELVRSLDTQTPQVLVEARIVEATSRYIRDLGIQWGGDASFSAATGNSTGLAFPNSIGLAGGASDGDTPTQGLSPFTPQVANPNFAVNLPAAAGAGAGGALGLTLGSVDSNFNLNLRLSAAESTGMVRILSSPRILTLDNHEARISQGTLIPFSQVSAQGVQTTFQEAKLQLMVEPHVTADGSVAMHVKINRDEPDFNQTSARGDPTILKREAETDLLVMDGHTAVIGGIYTRNTGRNVDQVPFFGDIPLIGLLFQNRNSSDQRGELVIFLTPRIVNRAQALGR